MTMQAAPSTGAVMSAADPPSVTIPSAIPKHYRYSSRSNSFSSASVVTVKRTGSLSSSGTGTRNSALPIRAQSPGETSLIALRIGREQFPQDRSRRKSVAVDAAERPDGAILSHIHKKSSSTASTVNSTGNSNSAHAGSGAIFGGLRDHTSSPKKRSAGTIDYSPRTSLQRPQLSRTSSSTQSPAASPERERRRPSRAELTSPLNLLPPLNPTPALTDPNDAESPSTIQTIATPSTQASYKPDYFGEHVISPNSVTKPQAPTVLRNLNDPLPTHDQPGSQPNMSAFGADPIISNSQKPARSDLPMSSIALENGRRKPRNREKGEKEKKVMLSQALQRANTAVFLDNAQNFEGAIAAYTDACDLLQQVMDRSTGTDDKRKLEAIKSTYTSRIDELQQMDVSQPESSDEKSLPPRPTSTGSSIIAPVLASPPVESARQAEQPGEIDAVPGATDVAHEEVMNPGSEASRFVENAGSEARSLQPAELDVPQTNFHQDGTSPAENDPPRSPIRSEVTSTQLIKPLNEERRPFVIPPLQTQALHLPLEPDERYMPAPLSPKRSNSPQRDPDSQSQSAKLLPALPLSVSDPLFEVDQPGASTMWLDTIDEDRSSRTSSVHSVSSQQGLRRKHLRPLSGASNADFDAAFDAAVEAAYDQGLEPDTEGGALREETRRTHMSNESVNVRASDIVEISPLGPTHRLFGDPVLGADEEEERLMDAIARDYGRGFTFDLSTKSALPRQSDSSGYSSRSTWQSSMNSDRTTAGTSLSTVAEDASSNLGSKNAFAASSSMNSMLAEPSHLLPLQAPQPPSHPPPAVPPPQTMLPPPPPPPPPSALPQPIGLASNRNSGVRSRRLSGQHAKALKIETPGKLDTRKRASTFHHTSSPFKEEEEVASPLKLPFSHYTSLEPLTASDSMHSDLLKSPLSIDFRSGVSDSSRPVTATTPDHRHSMDDEPTELRSPRPTLIKKNKSSISLREHTVLLASPTFDTAPSLMTPLSSTFMNFSSKRNTETPLTSQRATLPPLGGAAAENILLFSTSLTAPDAAAPPKVPPTPNTVEACPESFLLRPFWLMRNISATLIHPKGGFLTSRLFVPREAWQTKGVKLKSVEDKIATCDMLTAALGRLAGVDTYDADAVMDELQIFEDVMDRVQSTLVKKLGGEVGVGGLPGIFKDMPTTPAANNNLTTITSNGAAVASDTATLKGKDGNSFVTSWRKLRSKSSGAPTSNSAPFGRNARKASENDAFNMPSVPITSSISVKRRGAQDYKKDVRSMTFDGEHRHYMSSLASLFESVQVLDQIARQVEDPGLKAVSSTHVGMELSIRHAAEFFGFYICRFVLADLGILLDKFVKRGSEWVLA